MSGGTEQPTEHRLREARKKGDRPYSRDSSIAFIVLSWAGVLLAGGAYAFELLQRYMSVLLGTLAQEPGGAQWGWEMLHLGVGLGAIALIGLVIVVIPELIQAGGMFASKRPFIDFNRINPAGGLKKLFGLQRLVELLMAILRLAMIAATAWFLGLQLFHGIARLSGQPWLTPYFLLSRNAIRLLGLTSLLCLAMGGIDLLVQRKLWIRRNRMKKEEITREHKDQQGDPHIRAARQAAHREISGQ